MVDMVDNAEHGYAPDTVLERIRLLLDVEERVRAHATLYGDIRKGVAEELSKHNEAFAKFNASKAEAAKREQAEKVAAQKEDEEQQRPAPTRTPSIYPPGSGPQETDTTRRI